MVRCCASLLNLKTAVGFKQVLIIVVLGLSAPAFSADIFSAEKLYAAKEYDLARQEYLKAATLGNPHAYYRLGTIFHKGLGVKPDPLNALIYFHMAAAQDFRDTKKIMDSILSKMDIEQRNKITDILNQYQMHQGAEHIQKTYYPELIPENLDKTIVFEGQTTLENKFYGDDYEGEEYESLGEDEFDDEFYIPVSSPKLPYVIVDSEVAKDGTIRNISDVQVSGYADPVITQYKRFPGLKPTFDGKPVEFVNRVSMGLANYNKFRLRDESPHLYREVIRKYNKLKKADSLNEQYLFTMALQNFPWLNQEDGEVEQRLLQLAKQGHPGAMYEYGFKLYREQREIAQAVKWISRAGSYGLTRAEYQLAKLLTTSPWVVKDEKKALFWFELAAEKDHLAAVLKVAELKLLAVDKSLHDFDAAMSLLAEIESQQRSNPDYFHLLAVSHIDRENRDFNQMIKNLKKAISLGSRANWDVSEWKALLASLTQGTVTIEE